MMLNVSLNKRCLEKGNLLLSLLFKITICLSIVMILFTKSNTCYGTSYIFSSNDNNINESSISTSVSSPVFIFESFAQILMEPYTGNIIYANNENERIYPASVTKIMTLLLIMENIDSGKIKYDDKVTCSANASSLGGSQIWFEENEQISVEDGLRAICIASANDVTVSMAEYIGGSEENFVKMMNEKAKLLGMNNTNFVNPHGLHDDNHYTTAMDIAIMSREIITKHKDIFKFTSIWMDSIRGGTFDLSNTNKLVKYYEGGIGLKTGYTSQSLYNLSGVAKRDDTMFLTVVCKAPSSEVRLNETKQLLDFGFSNYEVNKIMDYNCIIDNISLNKSIDKKYNVIVKDEISMLKEKGVNTNYINVIEYNKNINLPITSLDSIGRIKIVDDNNNIVEEKDIYLECNVFKSNIKDYLKHILNKVIT